MKSYSSCLLGAIAGDVIGSVYEFNSTKSYDFSLFTPASEITDDTILTIAVADAILTGGGYGESIHSYARRYPGMGYGGFFGQWILNNDPKPYNSFGNGSAMRVSPVGWAFNSVNEVLREAERSSAVTHNHPEGIKGAQAVALAIYLARAGSDKAVIKSEIETRFGYNLSISLDQIRPSYKFDETCQGSVPESIISFLESTDFESAIRNAVFLAGDADTMAAIAGSIAEVYYGGVPAEIASEVLGKLPPQLLDVVVRFGGKFS